MKYIFQAFLIFFPLVLSAPVNAWSWGADPDPLTSSWSGGDGYTMFNMRNILPSSEVRGFNGVIALCGDEFSSGSLTAKDENQLAIKVLNLFPECVSYTVDPENKFTVTNLTLHPAEVKNIYQNVYGCRCDDAKIAKLRKHLEPQN